MAVAATISNFDARMVMNCITYFLKMTVKYVEVVTNIENSFGNRDAIVRGKTQISVFLRKLVSEETDRMCWYLSYFKRMDPIKYMIMDVQSSQNMKNTGGMLKDALKYMEIIEQLADKIKIQYVQYPNNAAKKKFGREICKDYSNILSGMIFPSLSQMKKPYSSTTNRSISLISDSVIRINKVVEDSLIVFSSKDRPFLLKFECSDGVKRALIFKKVQSSALESIASNVFANGFLHSQIKPDSESFFSTEQSFYSILPISKTLIVLEVIEGIDTLHEYGNVTKHRNLAQSNNEFDAVRFEIKNIHKDFFVKTYYDLTPAEWFNRKVNLNVTMGFWWMVGAIFGIGDRNLKNIMIGPARGFVFIDFEALLGIGRELPCPETVRFRVGPLFRKFPGSLQLEDIYKPIMCSYFTYLKEQNIDFILYFSEILEHNGEKAFAAKKDFFMAKTLEEHLEKPFIIPFSSNYDHVESLIQTLAAPNAQVKMFEGWEPQF